MTKQAEDLTDLELKSLGYELLIALEQNKANLQIIQIELQKRTLIKPEEVDSKLKNTKK